MNRLKSTCWPISFRSHRLFANRRLTRSIALMLTMLITLGAGTMVWNRRGEAAAFFQSGSGSNTQISTAAGGGFGSNIPVRQAPMGLPSGVALDPQGLGFYVLDEVNSTILLRFVNTKPDPVTLAGASVLPNHINLIAGGGAKQPADNTAARDADLTTITGLAVDPTGKAVYLTAPALGAIIGINVSAQDFTVLNKTIAPGKATVIFTPSVGDFRALAIHPVSKEFYFVGPSADSNAQLVYRIDGSGNQTVFAGGGNPTPPGTGDGGQATQAKLNGPIGLVFESNGALLIAESGDARSASGSVRRVAPGGIITSLVTGLDFPTGITADNGYTYIAIGNAQRILRISPSNQTDIIAGNASGSICDQTATPTCGDGGTATNAYLSIPSSTDLKTLVMAVDAKGVYLPDYYYKRVRYINLNANPAMVAGTTINPQKIDTIVGNGISAPYDHTLATYAELLGPTGIAVDASGNLFIADTSNGRLRFVNRSTSAVTVLGGTPAAQMVPPGQIVSLNKNAGGEQVDDRITTATFSSPQGLAMTSNGLYLVDSQAGAVIRPQGQVIGRRSGVIRFLNTTSSDVTIFPNGGSAKVVVPPGQIKDIAGVRPPLLPTNPGDDGPANNAYFFPTAVAVDAQGNLFIADQGNNRIRKIDASTGTVTSVPGAVGSSSTAPLTTGGAAGIAFDSQGRLHIADTKNNRVLRQDGPGGTIFSVIADSSKGLNRPRGLAVDSTGKVYLTNAVTHQVLLVTAPDNNLGTVSVIAGTGAAGFSGDGGDAAEAQLSLPNPGTAPNDVQLTCSVIALADGVTLFTDTGNHRVRRLVRLAQPPVPPVVSVSAANYGGSPLASESIIAGFGTGLATDTVVATSIPLPTELAGTKVEVTDSSNQTLRAPLFFVSPRQVNYQLPPDLLVGPATVTVSSGDNRISAGSIIIEPVAPSLFSANSSGQGVAAALVLRVNADNSLVYEPVARYDAALGQIVPVPIDLNPDPDRVFLILFGTGIRYRSALAAVSATIGGASAEVLYADNQGGFVGLDQVNLRIPRSLVGSNSALDVVLKVDGKTANTVTVTIK